MTVGIGVPTTNSVSYIANTLDSVAQYTRCLEAPFNVKIFIALNGDENFIATKKIILMFIKSHASTDITLIECPRAGKNNALNMILKAAANCEIMHFLDDDVLLSKDTLQLDVNNLIRYESMYDCPVLVGSNAYAHKRSLKFYLLQDYKIIPALKAVFWRYIFSLPFEKGSEQPKFCLGGSVCFFIKDFPGYPPDDSGIADDGYIGNYFLTKKTENVLNNIIKPAGSEMYFEVAISIDEWLKQQVRIFTGVYYSYLAFPGNMDLFIKAFSWKYSVGGDFRGKDIAEKTVIRRVRLALLRHLQKEVLKRSQSVIERGIAPDWAIASSSKPYFV